MRMNFISLATLTAYWFRIIASYGVNDNDEAALREQGIKNLPILDAEPVLQEIAEMMESPDEATKRLAQGTLEELITQMRDKTIQFAKLTIHGVKLAVNIGAPNSAIRAKNESMTTKLWNLLGNLFDGILSFLGLLKKQGNIKTREEIFSVTELRDLEAFTRDDNEFIIHALKHTIAELDEVLEGKRDLMQHVEKTKHQISQNTIEDVKRRISHEEAYKKELEAYLHEKEQQAKKLAGID